jgi:hypothetical protein
MTRRQLSAGFSWRAVVSCYANSIGAHALDDVLDQVNVGFSPINVDLAAFRAPLRSRASRHGQNPKHAACQLIPDRRLVASQCFPWAVVPLR